MNKENIGSTLDSFLEEEGLLEECNKTGVESLLMALRDQVLELDNRVRVLESKPLRNDLKWPGLE